ncbi:MAG: sodium:solute symporter family protein, partial [Rickettsiaceae bacterium]|nr:sodium:solute symporter family protein [Rickettsiaceae bacterium]
MTFDIDLAIVISFLVVTLVVGLGQSSKVTNIKEYALGGRNFSTGALVATMVATWASGSGFLITLSRTYQDGLYFVLAVSVAGIQLLIMAFVLAPRMGEFLGTASVAESMGNMYGKSVRVITAIAGTIGAAGAIAVQFKVFGNLVGYFTNISAETAIIASGCVVTLYSAFGGIRAVTVTDIFQLFTFGFALPIIGIVIWNQLYLDNVLVADFFQNTSAERSKFNLAQVLNIGNPRFWQMVPLMVYFMIPSMFPAIYQRMIMAKNIEQIKKTCIISAVLLVTISLSTAWIPFLIYNVDPNIDPAHLPGYIINNYTYIGLKGLLVIGVIAMAMSTADSNINIASVFFAHDICAPLKRGRNKELLLSKVFSMLLGLSAIALALSGNDLFSIVLFTNGFYMPLVTIPLIASILGFRSSTLSVLIAMSAGLISVLVWRGIGIQSDPIAFAMLMNIVFLFGSHYLLKQPGGWVKSKRNKKPKVREVSRSIWQNFSFIAYCKKHSPINELSYTGLGIYFIIYTITTMYDTHSSLSGMHGQLILAIYQCMMVTGVLLAMYPIWPYSEYKNMKQTLAQVIWPVSIFFMLVFFNSFFVLMSDFKQLQFSVFSINMIITAMLFGWRLGFAAILVGSYMAVIVHDTLYPGYEININVGSPGFMVVYIMMIVCSAFLIF